MNDTVPFGNFAFISYSRADVRVASRLQSDLESYSLPADVPFDRTPLWRSKRLRPIFRDHTDLDVRNDSFWAQLDEQIRGSRYLILLCSPASAHSVYVNREVELFLASHDKDLDLILPIVVAGDVTATEGQELCLPACLRPFQARLVERNLPQAKDSSRLELLLKAASWLLRVKYDALYSRYRRRERRTRIAAIAAATAIGLVVFSSVGVSLWSRSAASSDRAAAVSAQAAAKTADIAKGAADETARRKKYLAQIRLAFQSLSQNELGTAKDALVECDEDLRDWEWRFLHAQVDQSLANFETPESFQPIGLSEDGKRLAICGPGEAFRIVELDDLQKVRQVETPGHRPSVVAISRSGDAVATGSDDGRVSIWRAGSGELVASRTGYEGAMIQIAFDPAGKRVYASNDGAVIAVDASSGNLVGEAMSMIDMAGRFALSADGSRLAALDFDGHRLVVFDATTTRQLWELRREHPTLFRDVAFHAEGRRLALATSGEGAKILDVESGDMVASVGDPDADVRTVQFDEGSEIGLGTYGGDVQIHQYFPLSDIVRELRDWNLYETEVGALAFDESSSMLLTSSLDGLITGRVWAFANSSRLRFRGHEGRVRRILTIQRRSSGTEHAPSFVTWADDDTARVWSISRSAAPIGVHRVDFMNELRSGRFQAPPVPARYSRNARFAVRIGPDVPAGAIPVGGGAPIQTVARLSGTAAGKEPAPLAHDGSVTCAAFIADGERIATASDDGSVRVWSTRDASLIRTMDGDSPIRAVAASPDGRSIVTGAETGEIRLRDPESDNPAKVLASGNSAVRTLDFSRDGTRVAAGDESGTVRIVDVGTGESVVAGNEDAQAVERVAFSPGGSLLLTVCRDGTAAIRDGETGKISHRLDAAHLADAAWNARGTRVLALSLEGSLEIWDAKDGTRLLQIPVEIGQGFTLQFLDDLDAAVLCGMHGSVRLSGR